MTTFNINLNYNSLREKSHIWIRRSSVFLGIASNIFQIAPEVSHVLDTKEQVIIVPPEVGQALRQKFLEEFETWVIGSALRDLIEGHSSFLLHSYGYAELLVPGPMHKGILEQRITNFDKHNVVPRSRKVFELLDCKDDFSPMFASLVKARNCFAHRNGIVANLDTNIDDSLQLVWRFLALKVPDENEDLVRLDLNEIGEYPVEAGQSLKIGSVEEKKSFKVGEQIRLNKHELNQILLGFHLAAEAAISGLQSVAKKLDVPSDAGSS
ncbi:hypothetical protein [Labrenzia sp. 011]|uniref:hypothetical protein n=1 Tax=Labrenzia sp. 011 TaxID=2171494 RepID=UPI0010570FA7|nr:hypothetical protein [Labrenzia sp. 011]